jgi:hypothetical protein
MRGGLVEVSGCAPLASGSWTLAPVDVSSGYLDALRCNSLERRDRVPCRYVRCGYRQLLGRRVGGSVPLPPAPPSGLFTVPRGAASVCSCAPSPSAASRPTAGRGDRPGRARAGGLRVPGSIAGSVSAGPPVHMITSTSTSTSEEQDMTERHLVLSEPLNCNGSVRRSHRFPGSGACPGTGTRRWCE